IHSKLSLFPFCVISYYLPKRWEGKKQKGRQKIDIKKVTKNEDRMVTFSKRKNGIYTKLSELSILCGADVGFLIYSGSGKPFTFGSPSFDDVAQRFLHGNHHSGIINGEGYSSSSLIVDAHKKVKMDEFCKNLNNLMEIKTDAEEEKLKMAEAAYAPTLPVNSDASWKVDSKDDEEEKQLLRRYEEYYEELCEVAAAKIRGRYDASASSSFPQHG
ncbi:agamous-like MADS-box protein AGL29, partial [Brassica napus]|uniref:agamous-like MADS-box protein AGL29 n=1 Tax=Brassica napus TaxID=3708 RepID=UPI00207A3DA0